MRNYTKEELSYIWIDSFLCLEYKFKKEILEIIGENGINTALSQNKDYIIKLIGAENFNTITISSNKDYLEFVLSGLENRDVVAVTFVSEHYPKDLFNVDCPPLVLYCKGDLSLLNGENFAIVGSRKNLPLSINIAENFAKDLSLSGFTLVTGIAEGVDSAVLSSALEMGKKAISVIAGGIDNIYPKSNLELIERISKTGLVVAEYPPEIVPKPYHFPVRNRIIAGLSKGVLVVSAGKKSGTLYTAEYADNCSKPVFSVPYSVGISSGEGCNDLIKKGAILCDDSNDIISYFGKETKKEEVSLTSGEKEIVDILLVGEMHIEKICSALNKKVFEITPLLSMLEMKKLIVKSGNIYGLTRNNLEV